MNKYSILDINNKSFEIQSNSFYERIKILKPSPDAQYVAFSDLARVNHEKEYFAEEIQCLVLQASLVIECLALSGRIKILPTDHNATVFSKIYTNEQLVIWSFVSEFPQVQSFCDSDGFSMASLIVNVRNIFDLCKTSGYYEIGFLLLDVIWPLSELNRGFNVLKVFCELFKESFSAISQIPSDNDRLFGKYFRVSFFGQIFGKDNGKVYVYREKKIVHLFSVSDRIKNELIDVYGEDKIENIPESGSVDVAKLNPSKGYYQITFVEPFYSKKELQIRSTQYEKCSNISQFSLTSPFTVGGKAQGSVEQQWLRRTIIKTALPMPCTTKRVEVVSTQQIDYEPIRVSYHQLVDRIASMENALSLADNRKIQQLLHGSLLVQVNEGPSKMAEVFLSNSTETKYTIKLRKAFSSFLSICDNCLKFHATWISDKPSFVSLQQEMEFGFKSLQEKLEKFGAFI